MGGIGISKLHMMSHNIQENLSLHINLKLKWPQCAHNFLVILRKLFSDIVFANNLTWGSKEIVQQRKNYFMSIIHSRLVRFPRGPGRAPAESGGRPLGGTRKRPDGALLNTSGTGSQLEENESSPGRPPRARRSFRAGDTVTAGTDRFTACIASCFSDEEKRTTQAERSLDFILPAGSSHWRASVGPRSGLGFKNVTLAVTRRTVCVENWWTVATAERAVTVVGRGVRRDRSEMCFGAGAKRPANGWPLGASPRLDRG